MTKRHREMAEEMGLMSVDMKDKILKYGDKLAFDDHFSGSISSYKAGFTDAVELLWPLVDAIKDARACLPDNIARPVMYLDDALSDLEKKVGGG